MLTELKHEEEGVRGPARHHFQKAHDGGMSEGGGDGGLYLRSHKCGSDRIIMDGWIIQEGKTQEPRGKGP